MATISTVRICNMALSHVGTSSSMESIDENTPAAKQCKLWFDSSRIETLEAYDWSFARVRKTLAADSEDPPSEWTYRYQYPAGCVTARLIENPAGPDADAIPYQIELNASGERKTILTDAQDAVLICTGDITDPGLFSWRFVKSLSRKLAANIAYSLTGKETIAQAQENQWIFSLRQAMAGDGNEQKGRVPREAESIEARN